MTVFIKEVSEYYINLTFLILFPTSINAAIMKSTNSSVFLALSLNYTEPHRTKDRSVTNTMKE